MIVIDDQKLGSGIGCYLFPAMSMTPEDTLSASDRV